MIGAFCNVNFTLHFWGFPGQLGFLGWLLALCCAAAHGLVGDPEKQHARSPPKQQCGKQDHSHKVLGLLVIPQGRVQCGQKAEMEERCGGELKIRQSLTLRLGPVRNQA